jgi:FG-GAP repeat protein
VRGSDQVKSAALVIGSLGTVAAIGFVVYGCGQPSASPPGDWRQTAYLKAQSAGDGDQFGYAVAVSADGNTLAVGAPMENSGSTGINGNQADESADDAGAVYVFARSGDRWVQQAYIKASNAESFDHFGNAVALSADGNTLAVAAYFEASGATGINGEQHDNSRPQSGAVYVFTRGGGTWTQQAYVKASNTGEQDDGDTFGYSIALSSDGNTLAVGAPSEDSSATGVNGNQPDNTAGGAGAAYVFFRSGDRWSQQAYVKAANTLDNMLFGYAVGLSGSGDALAVGSFDERGCSNVINGPYEMKCGGTGAVYAFTRTGGVWSQNAYLKAREQDRGDSLGNWVAVSEAGDMVATAAADEDSMTTGVNAVESGHSGRVGAEDDRSSGAGYVFVRAASGWVEEASFKASNTGITDWFGQRLALSGDGATLAFSAPNEDSAARGLGGKQDDESADQAGAVYVFTRTDGQWRQQVYAKGSNTEAFDEFGSALSLDRAGRTMVVGAHFEDSNGDEADNSVVDAGAVYVFAR